MLMITTKSYRGVFIIYKVFSHLILLTILQGGYVIKAILQIRKLRLGEVNYLVQALTGNTE